MALKQTDYATGVRPMPVAKGSEILSVRMEYSLAAALALNDVIEMGLLPEDHVPVDWDVDTDDLDTNGAPAIAFDVGILNAGKTAVSTAAADGGAKWAAGLTTAQAGGLVRAAATAHKRVTPSPTSRRSVGLVIGTGPATGAATGKIALTLHYRAAKYGQ